MKDVHCVYCDGQVMWKQKTGDVVTLYYCKNHGDYDKRFNEGNWSRFVGNVPSEARPDSGALKSM